MKNWFILYRRFHRYNASDDFRVDHYFGNEVIQLREGLSPPDLFSVRNVEGDGNTWLIIYFAEVPMTTPERRIEELLD